MFENYPSPTYIFFLVLIIGIIPSLFIEADAKNSFRLEHYIIMLVGIIIMASLRDPEHTQLIETRDIKTYTLFFVSGFLGSAALILPGLSGSFILLVLGVYYTVISALSQFEWSVIFVTAAGIVVGIITMSKIIHYFLSRHYTRTYSLIIGLVIGSIAVIFPGVPNGFPLIIASLMTFIAGLIGAFILSRVER